MSTTNHDNVTMSPINHGIALAASKFQSSSTGPSQNNQAPSSNVPRSDIHCNHCKELGHTKHTCAKRPKNPDGSFKMPTRRVPDGINRSSSHQTVALAETGSSLGAQACSSSSSEGMITADQA